MSGAYLPSNAYAGGAAQRPHAYGTSVQTLAFLICALLVLTFANDAVLLEPAGLTLYLAEAFIWLGFTVVLALHFALGSQDPVGRGLQVFPEGFLYFGWCAFAALMVLGLSGSMSTIGKVKTAVPGLLLGLLVIRHAASPRQVAALCSVLVAGAAVNGGLGLLQVSTGGPYPVMEHENNAWKTDIAGEIIAHTANGLFTTPNNLGAALAPAAVIGLRLGISRTPAMSRSLRVSTLLAAILVIAALGATQNRGAMLFGAVGALVAFAPLRRKVLLAVLSVGATVSLLAAIGLSSGDALGTGGADTLVTRARLWWAAWITVNENPGVLLFGGGQPVMETVTASLAGWRFPTAHNGWLDQLILFGLPALALYVLAWAAALGAVGRRLARTPPSERAVLEALLGALAVLAGLLVLEPRAEGVFAVGQVFLLFGLVLSDGLRPRPGPSGDGPFLRAGERG